MTPDMVIDVGNQALEVVVMLCAPVMLSSLAIGLLVAMFQAATQINEMTLSFVPKLMVIALVLLMTGPWMLRLVVGFTKQLIESIPSLIG